VATFINVEDYQVEGEKSSLYWGFGIVGFFLVFMTASSVGILAFLIVAYTAATVWIKQSQYLGTAAKVSEKQFPKIYAIAKEAADRLCMPLPTVFIRQDPTLNASAIGFLGKKSVVLHSATVEAMDENELQQIIGHELSHIKCGHTNIGVLTNSSQGISVPFISQLLSFIFLFWSRKAEYTCDRGGLLACRDLKGAIASICKIAVGPSLFQQMDIDDFLNQKMELDGNDVAKLSESLATHPYLVKRLHALQEFHESNKYKLLTGTGSSSFQEDLMRF
jgi:Zn-dependent protease with chaperone function